AAMAQAAYARSGDEVRAALVFATLARLARSGAKTQEELVRAEKLADAARQRLSATGLRGRETYDVLLQHGELAQAVGRQRDAARILAARAQGRAGDAAGAVATLATVLGREKIPASVRASAASVLREAGRLDDAERELTRAENEMGEGAELFLEERGRLAAAR